LQSVVVTITIDTVKGTNQVAVL